MIQSFKYITCLLLCFLVSAISFADEIEVNGIKYEVIKKAKVAILLDAYNCKSSDVNIPSSVTYEGVECEVTKIQGSAFTTCEQIESFYFPNSIKEVWGDAFKLKYNNANSVHISDMNAWLNIDFRNESANPLYRADNFLLNENIVTEVSIPSGFTKVNQYVFINCKSLKKVNIPNTVTEIGSGAFYGCISLKEATLPKSVRRIKSDAFRSCEALESVTVPNLVTEIEWCSFWGCKSLKKVVIPRSVKVIESGAFAGCEELTDVYCYSTIIPNTDLSAFENSQVEYATLHVPANLINQYKSKFPWKRFGKIVPIK